MGMQRVYHSAFIVDDNPVIRSGLRTVIERDADAWLVSGEASDGNEALERMREDPPDAAIVDIEMPRRGGLELIRAMTDLGFPTRIVVLSAYDNFQYVRESLMLGAVDYLLKPLDPDYLADLLLRIADQKQLLARNAGEVVTTAAPFSTSTQSVQDAFFQEILFDDEKKWSSRSAEQAQRLKIDVFGNFVLVAVRLPMSVAGTPKAARLMRTLESHLIRSGVTLRPLHASDGLNRVMLLSCHQSLDPSQIAIIVDQALREVRSSTDPAEDQRATDCVVVVSSLFYKLQSVRAKLERCYLGQKSAYYTEAAVHLLGPERSFDGVAIHAPADEEEALLEAVNLGDTRSAGQIAHRVAAAVAQERPDPTDLVAKLERLLDKIVASSRALQATPSRQLSRLRFSRTVEDFSSAVKEFAEKTARVYRGPNERRMEAAVDHMERHFAEDLRLDEVAIVANMSVGYFSRKFKEYTGVSFLQFVRRVRVQKAARYLLESSETVAAIGKRVGYTEPVTFNRAFNKIMGMAPNEYRRARNR